MRFIHWWLLGSLFFLLIIPIALPLGLTTHTLSKISLLIVFFYVRPKTKDVNITTFLLFSGLTLYTGIMYFISLYPNAIFPRYEALVITVIAYMTLSAALPKIISKIDLLNLLISVSIITTFFILSIDKAYASLPFHTLFTNDTTTFIEANLQRGKVYIENYTESVLPLLIIAAIYYKNTLLYIATIFLIFLGSLIANFRTNVAMAFLGSSATLIINFKALLKNKVAIMLFSATSVVLIITLLFLYNGRLAQQNTIIDRFLLTNEEDRQTIQTRWEQYKESFSVATTALPFGIGPGNYSYYIQPTTAKKNYQINSQQRVGWDARTNPHNIFLAAFTELGVGSLFLFSLLFLFLYWDIKKFSTLSHFGRGAVLSFWTLLLYGLVNPVTSLKWYVFFIIYRVLIERDHSSKGAI